MYSLDDWAKYEASRTFGEGFSGPLKPSLGAAVEDGEVGYSVGVGRPFSKKSACSPVTASPLFSLFPTSINWLVEYFCSIEEAVAGDNIGPLIL